MRASNYLKYFSYLAFNWNPWIAWHIIRQEIRGEKKYGIETTGSDELHSLEEKGIDISHATIYMPASYALTESLLQRLSTEKLNHFLDLGSGKGRAMCIAAHFGYEYVTGVDLSKELCQEAIKNLEITKALYPNLKYKVVNNDAFYFDIPKEADCIFLFNPFDEIVMKNVVKNINKSLRFNPRNIFVIYLNPLHKNVFQQAGYEEIFYTKKMKYLEASILKKTPGKNQAFTLH